MVSTGTETTWTVARYAGDDDLEALLGLARRGDPLSEGGAGFQHPGDIVWRLFQNETVVPEERIRLVRDQSGAAVGMIGVSSSSFDFFVPPDVPEMAALLRFMVAQAESMMPDDAAAVCGEVPSHQTTFAEVLRERGYAPTETPPFFCNLQSLVGVEFPAPGHPVRPVGEDELDARTELHRRVWEPSKFSLDGYRRLRERPVYRPDLDLVAVTPEGDLAAYAIVWWDPETRSGEFEPVGADERFRRQGYATAVMREGLRRLQALGAERAVVLSDSTPERAPSNALYRATGFAPAFTFVDWEKRPGS